MIYSFSCFRIQTVVIHAGINLYSSYIWFFSQKWQENPYFHSTNECRSENLMSYQQTNIWSTKKGRSMFYLHFYTFLYNQPAKIKRLTRKSFRHYTTISFPWLANKVQFAMLNTLVEVYSRKDFFSLMIDIRSQF